MKVSEINVNWRGRTFVSSLAFKRGNPGSFALNDRVEVQRVGVGQVSGKAQVFPVGYGVERHSLWEDLQGLAGVREWSLKADPWVGQQESILTRIGYKHEEDD